ncbi:MAG: 50S ribosomal protein L32 [Bacillota bacterium]
MAVPKKKHSRARRDRRRAQTKVTVPQLTECPRCHEMKRPHHVCPNCGYYKGRMVTSG